MRLEIDVHHEQMMEAERLKDLITWEIIGAEQGSEREAMLCERLEAVIRYGMRAMREADIIASLN